MIAICSMVRKPLNFETWLLYHINMGIDFFFLRVEDTPELSLIIDKYIDKIYVEYYDDVDKLNNYHTIQDRQREFINNSIKNSLDKDIKWLLHIDSDELFYSKIKLIELLTPISENFTCIHFQNFEAVYKNDNLDNVFVNTNTFINCKNGKCLSYANGKSIGRVSKELTDYGPHYFSGKVYTVNDEIACVLHFDSPNFNEWYNKFNNLSNITNDKFNNIPFNFYRESINIVRTGDIKKCKEYYNKMKVEPYKSKDIIKIYF